MESLWTWRYLPDQRRRRAIGSESEVLPEHGLTSSGIWNPYAYVAPGPRVTSAEEESVLWRNRDMLMAASRTYYQPRKRKGMDSAEGIQGFRGWDLVTSLFGENCSLVAAVSRDLGATARHDREMSIELRH